MDQYSTEEQDQAEQYNYYLLGAAVPMHFVCPISLEIMQDPVTLCTGISYDRVSIHTWIYAFGHNTCPVSNQRLVTKDLLPNLVLRSLILRWQSSIDGHEQQLNKIIIKHPLAVLSSNSSPAHAQQAFHNIIQELRLRSDSIHSSNLLQALRSLQISMLSIAQRSHHDVGSGQLLLIGVDIAISTLTSLLSTRADHGRPQLLDRPVCEKTLELLEKLLAIAAASYGVMQACHTEEADRITRVKARVQAQLVPTIVAHTMVDISAAASLLSLRILCRVCKEEERCCRAAAKGGAVSKVLMLLQSAHSSSRIKRKALRLLNLLSGQVLPRDRTLV